MSTFLLLYAFASGIRDRFVGEAILLLHLRQHLKYCSFFVYLFLL